MILKQGHKYEPMPHDGKVIRRIYRGGRCYYIASPYSPEATQALRAAFPQYWTAIRNYGWANPALVPFINEDPMLIVSLVEVGKTRWLVGDGKAYIDTGVKSSANTIFEMQMQYLEVVGSSQFNGVFATDHRMQIGSTQQGFGIGYGSLHITVGENKPNITHTAMIDGKQKKGFYNGEEINFASASFNANKSFNIYLFARLSGDTNAVDAFCKERVTYSKIEDDNIKLHLCPFTRNGENGMLDILSGTFYPNANTEGTFTIQVTDKAT